MQGVIKFFNETKGFGFIKPTDGSSQDVFVHVSGIEDSSYIPQEGDNVEYTTEADPKGQKAVNVRQVK